MDHGWSQFFLKKTIWLHRLLHTWLGLLVPSERKRKGLLPYKSKSVKHIRPFAEIRKICYSLPFPPIEWRWKKICTCNEQMDKNTHSKGNAGLLNPPIFQTHPPSSQPFIWLFMEPSIWPRFCQRQYLLSRTFWSHDFWKGSFGRKGLLCGKEKEKAWKCGAVIRPPYQQFVCATMGIRLRPRSPPRPVLIVTRSEWKGGSIKWEMNAGRQLEVTEKIAASWGGKEDRIFPTKSKGTFSSFLRCKTKSFFFQREFGFHPICPLLQPSSSLSLVRVFFWSY